MAKQGIVVTIIVDDGVTQETRTFLNTTGPETTHEYDYLGVEPTKTRFKLRLEAFPNEINVIEITRTETTKHEEIRNDID